MVNIVYSYVFFSVFTYNVADVNKYNWLLFFFFDWTKYLGCVPKAEGFIWLTVSEVSVHDDRGQAAALSCSHHGNQEAEKGNIY